MRPFIEAPFADMATDFDAASMNWTVILKRHVRKRFHAITCVIAFEDEMPFVAHRLCHFIVTHWVLHAVLYFGGETRAESEAYLQKSFTIPKSFIFKFHTVKLSVWVQCRDSRHRKVTADFAYDRTEYPAPRQ